MKIIVYITVFLVLGTCNKKDEIEPLINRNDTGLILDIPLSGSLQNPAFSPDGNSIVFTRFRNGYNEEPADIYIYDLTTGALKALVSDGSGNINLPGSVWNNTIHSIVFSSTREPHDEIFLISDNGTTGDEIRITQRADYVAYEPSLSPDGQWVVFESHRLDVEENGVIIKYKVDKSSPYLQLTASDDDCRQPNWSPRGDLILYQKFDGTQWDIWVMNTDGTNKHKGVSTAGDDTDACFSQDGEYIIFSTDFELDMANIYKIPVTGGTPQRLSLYGGYDGAPSVSPDGSQIIFESYAGDPDESQGTKLVLLNIN